MDAEVSKKKVYLPIEFSREASVKAFTGAEVALSTQIKENFNALATVIFD
jgi:hypothetical protein